MWDVLNKNAYTTYLINIFTRISGGRGGGELAHRRTGR